MTETNTQIAVQDIPEWMKNYMATADPNYTGILDEAMRQYEARSGQLTDAQLAALTPAQLQVAGRTPLQTQAGQLAASGVGSYLPMLQAGAGTVGAGVTGLGTALQTMQEGYNPLAAAQTMVTDAYTGAVPYRDYAVQQMQAAIPDVQAAGARGELAAAGAVRGITDAATAGARTGEETAGNILSSGRKAEEVGLTALRALPEYGTRMEQQGQTTARNILQAGSAADEIGQYGLTAAQAGIAGLRGSAAEFDPSAIQDYMNPYEQSVIDAAMQDVARAGAIQRNQMDATAVGAGAFGGARQGVQAAEIGRNVIEQQAKTAAGLRQAGYESAAQRAQAAYESAKGRQQQAAGLTGQLGQAGAATGLQATQAGMQAAQAAGQAAQQGTQAGANIAGQATQLGLAGIQQGMQGAQAAGQAQMQGAQMGMQGAQSAGQMGLAGAQASRQAAGQAAGLGAQVGQMGQQFGQMGLASAGQMGAIAGQYGQLGQGIAGVGQGLGSLGMQQAQLGEAQQGLNLNDVNTLLSVGAQEQQQRQAELDASYANQMAQYQRPMQELGFYSDIFQGMPIGQSTYSQTTTPAPSTISQLGGLAGGLYGMYRATR